MKRKELLNWITIILGIACLLLPLVCFDFTGESSLTEKRRLAALPAVRDEDGAWNKAFLGELATWFEDRIGFRSEMNGIIGRVKLQFMPQTVSSKVHVGEDGWYFLNTDNNLQLPTVEFTITHEMRERITDEFVAVHEYLEQNDISFVVVLVPSKSDIYPEKLRYSAPLVEKTLVDWVADDLERMGITVVRLKETLKGMKQDAQLYFKTDTHWNETAVYAAYLKVLETLDDDEKGNFSPISVTFEDALHTGDLGLMMGGDHVLMPEPTKRMVLPALEAVEVSNTAFLNQTTGREYVTAAWAFLNSSVQEKRALMYGDSMTSQWHFPRLMAEHFSEFSFVWSNYIEQLDLELAQPQMVIYEITERNLQYVGKELLLYDHMMNH